MWGEFKAIDNFDLASENSSNIIWHFLIKLFIYKNEKFISFSNNILKKNIFELILIVGMFKIVTILC